jgi:ABC-type transport system involved in multi-copper enzyme maturation permease subunit
VRGAGTIVAYAVREGVRRRVFVVVLVLTAIFLGLYGWGVSAVVDEVRVAGPAGNLVEVDVVAAATLLGLSMFGTLFLGAVLAAFLTLGVVRGDAERGLLQPLVVRPVGRATLILARVAAAGAIAGVYVAVVFLGAVLITGGFTGWWPSSVIEPALSLAGAVVIVAALSVLGSVAMAATANGIAVFMVFGAGLVAGLIGQIGEGISSDTLSTIGDVGSYALPFEGLYQSALSSITADTTGLTEVVVRLGPFGGAHAGGPALVLWAAAYLALVAGGAVAAFRRVDLS